MVHCLWGKPVRHERVDDVQGPQGARDQAVQVQQEEAPFSLHQEEQ